MLGLRTTLLTRPVGPADSPGMAHLPTHRVQGVERASQPAVIGRAEHKVLRGNSSECPGAALASVHVAVDCWIGVTQGANGRVVRLAGRLSDAQVPELLKACGEERPLELDLTDLVSADVAGIEALQRIRGTGVRLVGAPGYIQLKLDSPAGGAASLQPSKGRRRG
jgi:hypothetical protein